MLYDDFQNENSYYNCKDSTFRKNDIIILRQNDIKTNSLFIFSLMTRDISELMHKQVA